MTLRPIRALCLAVLSLSVPTTAHAQRELHWDNFEVAARLADDGDMEIVETQTMVFTGDWNGGERTFNIRPRQKLTFTGISRSTATGWQPLTEDASLDDVDDYAWTDAKTLRWRSRLRSDPPFAKTFIRYQLRYTLSGILLKDGDNYLVDHDFAFTDREGVIDRFSLRLTLDPAWQPLENLREVYMASGLAPGRTFVLKLPLRYTGAGAPAVLDLSRPPQIVTALYILIGATLSAIAWFFVREQSNGRFAPLQTNDVSEPWLRDHILKYPAEVVGAAWDDTIGPSEVVALLARMTSERKLASELNGGSSNSSSMTLHLKVDRSTLKGYEQKLVDALFFGGRSTTSTAQVKAHYQKQGFNPVSVIEKDLKESLQSAFPVRDATRKFRIETLIVFLFGLTMLVAGWFGGYINGGVAIGLGVVASVLAGILSIPGAVFRARIDWGRRAAMLCLMPALTLVVIVSAFLWYYAGTGIIVLPGVPLLSIVALTVAVANASINSLRSRQSRDGIALRKRLATGRAFFMSELQKSQPALRDDWYPWLLAFGLGKRVDDWSAERAATRDYGGGYSTSSSSSGSSRETFDGFSGGRSGGAGGGASWAAAAGGLAAGVSPPSSSGSGGGSGGGGGSSGGGSSGGGGGGGW